MNLARAAARGLHRCVALGHERCRRGQDAAGRERHGQPGGAHHRRRHCRDRHTPGRRPGEARQQRGTSRSSTPASSGAEPRPIRMEPVPRCRSGAPILPATGAAHGRRPSSRASAVRSRPGSSRQDDHVGVGGRRAGVPWSADWYRKQADGTLGAEKVEADYRLWLMDNADHGRPANAAAETHIVSYEGELQQAVLDLDRWVKDGGRAAGEHGVHRRRRQPGAGHRHRGCTQGRAAGRHGDRGSERGRTGRRRGREAGVVVGQGGGTAERRQDRPRRMGLRRIGRVRAAEGPGDAQHFSTRPPSTRTRSPAPTSRSSASPHVAAAMPRRPTSRSRTSLASESS